MTPAQMGNVGSKRSHKNTGRAPEGQLRLTGPPKPIYSAPELHRSCRPPYPFPGDRVTRPHPLIDIHCHLLPGLDDGARSWDEAIEMARIAEAHGTHTILATPHQLGRFRHVKGEWIRRRAIQLQQMLAERNIPIQVLPGAEVTPDDDLLRGLLRGDVLTLAEQRRHLLLELPPGSTHLVEALLAPLRRGGIVCILASPERHPLLQRHPSQIQSLIAQGCLTQITAGSLLGEFGPAARSTGEWMLRSHLVHFLASDARGTQSRRPLLDRAFQRVGEIVGDELAERICVENPSRVLVGEPVEALPPPPRASHEKRWFPWRRAA